MSIFYQWDQDRQCGTGDRHFHNGKGVNIFPDEPVHEYVQFNGTLLKQNGGQKCIRETEQNDEQCRGQGHVAMPVHVGVHAIVVTPKAAAPVQKQGAMECRKRGYAAL